VCARGVGITHFCKALRGIAFPGTEKAPIKQIKKTCGQFSVILVVLRMSFKLQLSTKHEGKKIILKRTNCSLLRNVLKKIFEETTGAS